MDMQANFPSCLFSFIPFFVSSILIPQYTASHPEPLAKLVYNCEKLSGVSW